MLAACRTSSGNVVRTRRVLTASGESSISRDDERRVASFEPHSSVAVLPAVSSRGAAARVAGAAGNPRGVAARGHHREQRDRGAWVERRDASFVSAGNLRFPACSQNASRSDNIAGRRPASGQNPADSGTITRERSSLERQQSPGQRGDGVASGRASGPCEAVSPPRIRGAERRAWPASRRRAYRGLSRLLNPYLNTIA